MKNKEIKKNEQRLIKLTENLNKCACEDWKLRYEQLSGVYAELKSLAASVGASIILGADILNIDKIVGSDVQSQCIRLEAFIGELHNNIHYALQTKMMLSACFSAKRSCFWAAIAAIAACITVILTLCLG